MKTQCKKSVTVSDFEFKEGELYDIDRKDKSFTRVGLKKTNEWEIFYSEEWEIFNEMGRKNVFMVFSDYFYTVEELRDQKINQILNEE